MGLLNVSGILRHGSQLGPMNYSYGVSAFRNVRAREWSHDQMQSAVTALLPAVSLVCLHEQLCTRLRLQQSGTVERRTASQADNRHGSLEGGRAHACGGSTREARSFALVVACHRCRYGYCNTCRGCLV